MDTAAHTRYNEPGCAKNAIAWAYHTWALDRNNQLDLGNDSARMAHMENTYVNEDSRLSKEFAEMVFDECVEWVPGTNRKLTYTDHDMILFLSGKGQ